MESAILKIRKIAFSDDDQYLAVATQKYRIDLWRRIEGEYVHYTKLFSNIPLNRYNFDSSLEFGRTPDNKLILVAGGREQVFAWQIGDEVKSVIRTRCERTCSALAAMGNISSLTVKNGCRFGIGVRKKG